MDQVLILVLFGVATLAAGGVLWFVLDQRYASQLAAHKRQLRNEAEQDLKARWQTHQQELAAEAGQMLARQAELHAEAEALAARQEAHASASDELEHQRRELELELASLTSRQRAELERIASLSPAAAREAVLDQARQELQAEYSSLIREHEALLKQRQNELAREILTRAVQRTAVSHAREQLAIAVPLPDMSWRGRVIGRDGRTVQALQSATGADFSLDEESPAVWVSSFDPWRRELARRSLEALIQNHHLHPARIEAEVERQQAALDAELPKLGEEAAFRAGVHDLHPELLRTLGRLQYRRSFGQDVLQHSVEVALLAAQLASQLGADVETARRGGLLHDLGKALAEPERPESHTELGVELARRCGEPAGVLHAIAAHHGDDAPHSIEALLVQVADTLSAARPGARSEQLAKHVQRLDQYEKIALGFAGVTRAWVLRAGKEVRVLVDPDEVPEEQIQPLARDIAAAIAAQLQDRQQVKVSVIREIQASGYARP
ncbi:MAG: ribonuclease Y [Candidatus Melainabacteria bacterium HGW-Melainabacteria-1]|nr:MAG: ribonuclease Y [Candidatus Melainabacteria bacterium HGW-Melainabacteria-1]